MADAAPQSGQSESMEDILQSIKRIIEDDTETKPTEPDVLELTQVIKDDGSVAPVSPPLKAAAPAAAAEPSQDIVKSIDAIFAEEKPAPTPTEKPAPAPAAAAPAPKPQAPKPQVMEDGLVSDQAAQAAAAALKPIAESAHKDYSLPPIPSPGLRGGNTVEDLILESLRPMLKAWLDENLPTIVQRIVEKEVKRIVKFHQD